MANFISDLLNLCYPLVCAACGNGLFQGESVICTHCLYHLPKTNFHLQEGNPVEKQFWGKVPVFAATALYYFNKGQRVQHLIHRLKYQGDKEVGSFTGRYLGLELLKAPRYQDLTHVVPVPLHESKKRLRGYNQSDFFGEGVAESMRIPFVSDFLIRQQATSSQTRKSRYSRFENMNRMFVLNERYETRKPHFLLVDDVITTGSTLASCAETLLLIPDSRVSLATIAYARL